MLITAHAYKVQISKVVKHLLNFTDYTYFDQVTEFCYHSDMYKHPLWIMDKSQNSAKILILIPWVGPRGAEYDIKMALICWY